MGAETEYPEQEGRAAQPAAEDTSFESRLEQITRLIDRIEGGQMPLEEAVSRYEEGIGSLNALEKELAEMKRRITILQEKSDGTEEETGYEEREN